MIGRAPIRRTMKYLESGLLKFQPEVRVLTVNYNINQKASVGAYEFQFWHFPQIKYRNPALQLLKFKNMTPTPFIQLLFINGDKMIIDVHGKSKVEIHNHLLETFCETEQEMAETIKWNPGAFGYHCSRWCICELPGQVPCPSFVIRNNKTRQVSEEEAVD